MPARLLLFAALVGGVYWYWSGPYQEKINPSYEAILEQNAQNMRECIRAAMYQAGATGSGPGFEMAQRNCAEKFGLYESDGQWHSYAQQRPDE